MENQEYQVVARRYRPQTFADLVGQEPIARALTNAITGNRIGHAYLFTGARGVGKTSSARIFAKALNCVHGPTPTPCNECEICKSISTGDDIDVLEIDGASNRGIEDIRSLRQNVNVRPIRARFKIYIIDEVHMLTREAFNALLKTLEEPPEHVKFIFCTTEAGKIPITILSRCQRFDFAGIDTTEIAKRLGEIVTAEGLSAEPAALALLARRANGSMRDGQSLLEQILAFVSERVTLEDVHRLLGTADDEVLLSMLRNICELDPAAMLRTMDAVILQGGDPASLLEQLFGCLRDLMALAAGCGADSLLFADGSQEETLRGYAQKLGMETILAAMQIIDHTLARMKVSTQARLLAEMALVRLCSLGNLENLADFLAKIQPIRSVETGTTATLPAPEATAGASRGSNGNAYGYMNATANPNANRTPSAETTNSGTSAQAAWQPLAGMTRSFASEVPSDFEAQMAAKKKDPTDVTSSWEGNAPLGETTPAASSNVVTSAANATDALPQSSATTSYATSPQPAPTPSPSTASQAPASHVPSTPSPASQTPESQAVETSASSAADSAGSAGSPASPMASPSTTGPQEASAHQATSPAAPEQSRSGSSFQSESTTAQPNGPTSFTSPTHSASTFQPATTPLSAVRPQMTPEAALRNALNALGESDENDDLDVLFRFSHIQTSSDGSTWTVEYDPMYKFALSRCGGFTSKIERELAEIWPRPVRVQLQTLDEATNDAGQPVSFVSLSQEREIVRQHPLIQAAETHLNATIQKVERVLQKQERT